MKTEAAVLKTPNGAEKASYTVVFISVFGRFSADKIGKDVSKIEGFHTKTH